MRLLRPYIPLDVRLQVAERQLRASPIPGFPKTSIALTEAMIAVGSPKIRLTGMLKMLFHDEPCHLDHDPPLAARKKVFKDGEHVGYKPDANDPNFLIYRTVEDHRRKTNLRGDGAQHPDRVLIKKNRKLERERAGKVKRKAKIRSANRWPPKGSRKLSRRKAHDRTR